MILDNKEYYAVRGDKVLYKTPLYKVGDKIKILFDDTDYKLKLTDKSVKKGNYTITKIINEYMGNGLLCYCFIKNGSKYDYCFNTIAIDKASKDGKIILINE